MNTPHATSPVVAPNATFRPWGIDTLGTIKSVFEGSVQIAWDHAPKVVHTFKRSELGKVGRVVNRDDYR